MEFIEEDRKHWITNGIITYKHVKQPMLKLYMLYHYNINIIFFGYSNRYQ